MPLGQKIVGGGLTKKEEEEKKRKEKAKIVQNNCDGMAGKQTKGERNVEREISGGGGGKWTCALWKRGEGTYYKHSRRRNHRSPSGIDKGKEGLQISPERKNLREGEED